MLSRTADSLYWLARYMERAECAARLLLVGHRMSSVARSLGSPSNEWHSTLIALGCEPGFLAKHGTVTEKAVIDYLVSDPDNPSSIASCLETARHNARAVRTALTVDMWESINETWRATRPHLTRGLGTDALVAHLEWVKQRSLLFTGAYLSTMLRNDAFAFTHLGTVIERADNTARILDVKYHLLLPEHEGVGGALDYAQWQSMLRAVSALRSYHWVYHDRLKPWLIAELMILRPEMPRSLVSCCAQALEMLDTIAERNGSRRAECHRLAGQIHAQLKYGRIETIFQAGLHEFLTRFIEDTSRLGQEIAGCYLRD